MTSADAAVTTPGATVGYTMTITNSGQTPYTGATVTNSLVGLLDDADYNADATASVGTVSFSTPTLTWTGSLNPGDSATISYTVTVDNPVVGDQSLTNTIVSSTTGSNCPSGGSDPRCTVTVTVVEAALLTFTKTAGAPSVARGGTVAYTITVANAGLTPYLGAQFTDDLTDVLTDVTFNDDAVASAGTVTYTEPVLSWSGDVPASGTITYSVTETEEPGGDHILVNSVESDSVGSNCPAASTDPRCTVSELDIVYSANVTSTTPGGLVVYTVTFTNTGQTPYTGITVSLAGLDIADDITAVGDQSASSGTLTISATGIDWTGSIPVGATVTVTGSVVVDDPPTGNRVLNALATTDAPGSNCPVADPNPACALSIPVLLPGLTMTTSANTSTTVPGGTVEYTVTITNSGETPYTGATVANSLAGVLDDAVYNGDALASAGSVSFATQTLTWTGDLAVDEVVTVTFTVTVLDPDPGDKLLANRLTSTDVGSPCPPASGNPGCTGNVVVLTPALTIVKSASVASTVPGGTVTYTIAVTNSGQTPFTGAAVSDALAGVLDDATYNGDAVASTGLVGFTSPDLTWTGDLAIGATATITYSVTTELPANGDRVATNAIASTTPGSTCLVGGGVAACTTTTAVLIPALVITKTADQTSAVIDSTVQYTITATNTGAAEYTGATISDDLASVVDNAVYSADATATTGAVAYTAPTLTWTGNLSVGAAVTITYSVTVDDTATAGEALTNRVESGVAGSTCTGASGEPLCTASTTIRPRASPSDLISSFTLSGEPGGTATQDGAVTMTVTTNSTDGYTVAVQGASPTLTPATPGNDDTIPVESLLVRGPGTSGFEPLSDVAAVEVYSQAQPSAPDGDAVSNDYAIDIPFVASDTYSTTLDYIAATQ